LTLHWEYLKGKGCYLKECIIWSDGCFAQFKSAQTWYYVAGYPQLMVCEQRPKGLQMCWNFFAFGHGKGEVDSASALLK